jgi:hypothetical protein
MLNKSGAKILRNWLFLDSDGASKERFGAKALFMMLLASVGAFTVDSGDQKWRRRGTGLVVA